MHKGKRNRYTQSVIRTIVTDLVYEKKRLEVFIINILQKLQNELLLLLCQNIQLTLKCWLFNFSTWGRGASEGVIRVAPYMSFPPFLNVY